MATTSKSVMLRAVSSPAPCSLTCSRRSSSVHIPTQRRTGSPDLFRSRRTNPPISCNLATSVGLRVVQVQAVRNENRRATSTSIGWTPHRFRASCVLGLPHAAFAAISASLRLLDRIVVAAAQAVATFVGSATRVARRRRSWSRRHLRIEGRVLRIGAVDCGWHWNQRRRVNPAKMIHGRNGRTSVDLRRREYIYRRLSCPAMIQRDGDRLAGDAISFYATSISARPTAHRGHGSIPSRLVKARRYAPTLSSR